MTNLGERLNDAEVPEFFAGEDGWRHDTFLENVGTLGFLVGVGLVTWVVKLHIFFIFIPIPRAMIQFDEHIFQMG